jgi:bifunctional pyridoxal-dependent enzyme with beta-cystathionase and maltose regulon repressor activities
MANRQALAKSYIKTTDFLKAHDIRFIPAQAGPFFMIDIRPVIRRLYEREATVADEKRIWHKMVNHGVYLAPSFVFHSKTPGFFRITFALPWNRLEDGLNRMLNSLKD